MFSPYQAVMVLGLYNNGDRYDTKGTYIGPGKGSQLGKLKVEVNAVMLHFNEEQLIEYNSYWDLFHGRVEGELPAMATKKHHFATYEGY